MILLLHGLLQVGAGFSQYGPIFNVVFGVKDLSGKEFSISVPDFLGVWLSKHIFPQAPTTILLVLAVGSLYFLIRRLLAYYNFEKDRIKDCHSGEAKEISRQKVGHREVDVYETPEYSGRPFTGGIFNPFICLPMASAKNLSVSEINAVLKHELAHIKY